MISVFLTDMVPEIIAHIFHIVVSDIQLKYTLLEGGSMFLVVPKKGQTKACSDILCFAINEYFRFMVFEF